ncbi:respiratory nitrate reductase subunit gamma [Cellulomonas sp. SLBN-39]|uniref:respiratory nitrate reductase subunit gamma n=1 Tax=Cellulomonas sp. SLBN-39 TaxID=2768446 RepID=UPI001152EA91|nr:respiratory nitrate reductase subunit gamma [Cellulomonas sp. SLBN-39]TQL04284.1 nitrate reductase gamma subunit [Cellulomonas sp. SLBN-39]
MTSTDVLLWVAVPYVAAAVFVVGHLWRYRYDQFGWTTRSSQVYENRLLRWGSPMFHVGVLMVAGGHVVGLLVPRTWLEAVGVTEHAYHLGATWLGTVAAVLTLAGLAILVYRRRTVGPVFLATTRSDKLMYVVLGATLALGTAATVMFQVLGDAYDYRGSIAPWVRGLLTFRPDAGLMADVPLMFQLHVLSAQVLVAIWPFTRLVHVFSAPVGYLVRPYVVYRSRDDRRTGSRAVRPGWERVERPGAARRR